MPTTWLGVDEPATIDARLGMEAIGYGTTNILAEHVVLVGTASNQFTQFASAVPATGILAPVVRVAPSTGEIGILTTGTISRIDFPAAAPYVPFNGVTASGGIVAMGLDGTATNSTARPFQINASGELKVAGSVVISGNSTAILTTGSKVQVEPGAGAVFPISGNASVTLITLPGAVALNGTAGTTGLLVYGADGTASNSTVRPLQVNSSGELKTLAAVTVPGGVIINTTGGSSALLMAGADGGTSNSTARTLNVNASRELLITGPVTISGNSTAVLTTGSKVQVEPGAGAVFGISGNATAVLSTAGLGGATGNPIIANVAQNIGQLYQGTTALAPQFASINVTASGISAIVTSAAGAIYVLAVQLSAASSCTVQWMEATTSGITGVQSVAANGGFVLPSGSVPWFKTASGLPLSLSVQGSSGGVGGSLVYARPAS